jgi:protein gp37
MATKSNIEWTDATWNIARGCTKVDEDCKFCYMYRESLDSKRYNPLQVVRTKTVFNLPLKLKEPSKIFTSSLTDFFHTDVDAYRNEAWDIIRKCPHHTFQILTKRPERINDHLPPDWNKGMGKYGNIWIGTSVGHQDAQNRITELLKVDACVRFLSCEPLHGYVNLNQVIREENGHAWCDNALTGFKAHGAGGWYGNALDWVIVGGESGNENGKYRYRECKLEWIESIVYQCQAKSIPVFVKQLGTHLSKKMGLKSRHGKDINEWPAHLQVREMPNV